MDTERRKPAVGVLFILVGLLCSHTVAQPSSPIAALEDLGRAFAQVAQKVSPAVVNVSTTQIIPGRRSSLFDDPLFRRYFGGLRRFFQEPDIEAHSLGSGVIVDPRGYVVTNNHVVANAQSIRVALYDGRESDATVVGTDPMTDLAVIRIAASDLPVALWGDSDALQVGEWVVAIGNPFGLRQTVTAGIVSAKERTDLGISGYESFIQTDAAINPGNSGGALVNILGELIGINTAIFSESGGYEGIGFAIPSSMARKVVEQIISQGRVIRGWIGVIPRPLTPRIAQRLSLQGTDGVLVYGIYQQSPVDQAGIAPGDVILALDGRRVATPGQLKNTLANTSVGTKVSLSVSRQGAPRTVTVEVSEQPQLPEGQAMEGI